MGTWNRLTHLMEEISQRTHTYICIAHGHRQQCREGQGVEGRWVEGGKGEKMKDIGNCVNNNNIKI